MTFETLNEVTLHYRYVSGEGMPIVFLNSLGTDFRIWDSVMDHLSVKAPVLCIDKRGHGLSDDGPITMGALVGDVSTLMDQHDMKDALICGVSVGGLIAQGLAATRPDLVAGLTLCCTGAKIGDADGWNARIQTVESQGIAPIADAVLERWFSEGFRTKNPSDLAGYRNMLIRTSAAGYAGVCAAIRDSDFTDQARRITVPTYCIAGANDLATPPALVQALAGMIKGARYEELDNCGHLPSIEQPAATARAISRLYETLK
ncbi:3-oxoadipate enol-lactonase [Shimia sp.]|uniref:3-oxoadipate enol-lactonase n=1 Tax=Shimia sp. TaxID=1954381 RepID=UPI003B8B988E